MANPEVLSLLEQQRVLSSCGDCAICSQCGTNCPAGRIGFDQDPNISSLCPQSTSSESFWCCVCGLSPKILSNAATASVDLCSAPSSNDTVENVLDEFYNICGSLDLCPPDSEPVSGPGSGPAKGPIVGMVIGGIMVVLILLAVALLVRSRRRSRKANKSSSEATMQES
jgi:hypothetical protein